MKSKNIVFTADELNAHSGIIKSTGLDLTDVSPFVSVNGPLPYPRMMIIDNQTASNIDFALLANQAEADDLLVHPSNYGTFTVRTGTMFTLNPCPVASGILVQGSTSGTATSNLTIWFGGYSW